MKIYSTLIVGFSAFDGSDFFLLLLLFCFFVFLLFYFSFELLVFSKYLLRTRNLNQLISLNRLQAFSANVLWRRLVISDRL